ncbi:hypothetical protein VNO77_25908 [Canavalia gladiata]|uniref:PWWP domain-containing protein n=1 Tax=Canavalia gladiata TaxID=3824 RepID=A0AAN9KV41_CANGL
MVSNKCRSTQSCSPKQTTIVPFSHLFCIHIIIQNRVIDIMRMQSGGGISRVRKGDIVWARVQFPHKWCPALVLTSDSLGVSVTFSFFHRNDVVSPTYFVESEVVPFEEAFPSLISRRNATNCDTLLHSALRLLGQRVISGLQCRCQMDRGQAQRTRNGPGYSSEFDPAGVLGFVLDAAVSPWVEIPRFAYAVRVVAQVHAFRAYSSVQHKKMYRQSHKIGDNVKLHPCSSLDQKTYSVTQEYVALEPKEKCQFISKIVEPNMSIDAMSRLKSTDPVSEGNFAHLFKNKRLIISKNLMLPPAVDPLYMVGGSEKSEMQSVQQFKSVSNPSMLDICFKKCSMISKAHISVPSNLKAHVSSYISKRKNTLYFNRKRRRLDKTASCHVTQIGRVQDEGEAYISKYTRPSISNIKVLEPEGSIRQVNQACTCFSKTNMNFADEVQTMDLKRNQNLTLQQSFTCGSSSNSVLGFNSDNCKVDASEAKFKGLLGSNSCVCQERLQMSCNGDTAPLELKNTARIELSEGDCLVEGMDSCSILNSEVGQQSKTHVPFSCASLHMKFPKNFNLPSKGQLIKKFSVFGSVDSSKTKVFWYTGSAQVAFLQETDAVAAYLYAKKKAWFGEANVRFWLDPFEHKRRGFGCSASKQIGPPLKSCLKNSNGDAAPLELKSSVRIELSEGNCLVEGMDSCSILKSKVGQQSKTHVPFSCTSLHMKFPKNFNLPSKGQLIKKFSVFGLVDYSKTRVFWYTGSAQVAFFQETDTVSAYLHAKKKAWFGEANVRYWLDPFEHKRSGFKCSVSKQPLKSCLKNSNSKRQKNRKKVRFAIES